MSNVVKFPRPTRFYRGRRVMTAKEFGAHVAELTPPERADLSAKIQRLADDGSLGLDADRLRRLADGLSPGDRHPGPCRRKNRIHGPNMHTFLFRSRDLILEADEADLVRDVCLNVDRAQTKLRQLRERLQGVQEWAASQVEELTAAETKLAAAIASALLSSNMKG